MKPFECLYVTFLCFSLIGITGCVGPTTPFGSIDSVVPASETQQVPEIVSNDSSSLINANNYKEPMIRFHPRKQVLHDRSQLEIQITDAESIPAHFGFKIFHNSRDVTSKFLAMSKIEKSKDDKKIKFKFKDLRLRADDINEIQVVYEKSEKEQYSAKLLPPTCSLFEESGVLSISGFKNAKEYIGFIESIARKANYNPGFLAGIVAQESGFNHQAVSWAKAIGLTQITPLAEEELFKKQTSEKWPRFPKINKMHYLKLKAKILTGEIGRETEWRLNPRYSIQGGMTYISYLQKYWDLTQNKKIIESLKGDYHTNLSYIILASYNSGAARVKAAIVSKGDDWKSHNKLKEAYKYLNKVSSYCYHFSSEENG